jgi:purine-binding chemotaxis protein CheW
MSKFAEEPQKVILNLEFKGDRKMVEEQFVVFQLSKEEYAISIFQVREIINYEGATALPNMPNYMPGIISLRGKIMPVFDLAARFQLDCPAQSDRKAIIIETADREVAIIVGEVTEVKRISEGAIEDVQIFNSCQYGHMRGIGKDGGRLIILLDVERLFSRNDLNMLNEIS